MGMATASVLLSFVIVCLFLILYLLFELYSTTQMSLKFFLWAYVLPSSHYTPWRNILFESKSRLLSTDGVRNEVLLHKAPRN